MIKYIPTSAKCVLDIGCNTGGFGEALNKHRNVEVWGVEPKKDAAEIAKLSLDFVVEDIFHDGIELPNILHVCNLKHMLLDADFKYEKVGIRDQAHLRLKVLYECLKRLDLECSRPKALTKTHGHLHFSSVFYIKLCLSEWGKLNTYNLLSWLVWYRK